MNPSIQRIITGKTEAEAQLMLEKFKCRWRVIMRDGKRVESVSQDRDDNRYNLIIRNGLVERVLPG
jgi:hypothetical protein